MDVGPTELIIILVIVLVLFGGAKLPKLAKSLGEAQREFKRGTNGEKEDLVDPTVVETKAAPVVDAPMPPAAQAVPPVVATPTDAPSTEQASAEQAGS